MTQYRYRIMLVMALLNYAGDGITTKGCASLKLGVLRD
jgi:hypothetical protein